MNNNLIIRFSSFGDVAIAIPVVYSIARRYTHSNFFFLTKNAYRFIFLNKPRNLQIISFPKKKKQLRQFFNNNSHNIIDLHAVLRSFSIDLLWRLKGAKVSVIDKGRKEKKLLISRKNKQFTPLISTIERYQSTFEKLGFDASLNFISLFDYKKKKKETWIGIAPFSKHFGKTYPIKQMESVVQQLSKRAKSQIFFFGEKNEKIFFKKWASKYKNTQSIPEHFSIEDELRLINDLDIMISMDSANMHFASLVNTPVISIWGPTHPYAGFYGYKQDSDLAVQIDLPCRPCSIFGDKTCYFQSYTCLTQITPEMIIDKVETCLSKNKHI